MPNVYLGSADEAQDIEWLRSHNIRVILNCASNVQGIIPQGVIASRLNLIDSPDENISRYFEPTAQFLDVAQQRGPTLVHCAMGVSRSASILLYWLMTRYFEGSLQRAMSFLREKRPIINPNSGYMMQLENVSTDRRSRRRW
jgi:protein-tyrosine phosphatase